MPISLFTQNIEFIETERPASGFYWSTISSWEEVGLRLSAYGYPQNRSLLVQATRKRKRESEPFAHSLWVVDLCLVGISSGH